VSEEGYAALTSSTRQVGQLVGAPVGCVLEGGYALEPLARSVAATMEALAQPATEPPAETASDAPLAPLAEEARQRLSPWWAV
jgi:acetoin utilization deacetylase AcuC-like enzyme